MIVSLITTVTLSAVQMRKPEFTEMAGYLIVPHDKVDSSYNAGFSMYVSAWPLLQTYPGNDFQSGLFGTWMFPQFEGKGPKDHYTDIEGGLGWWRDTRFASETPKFIMGGVALNFSEWANGPGAGKGRNWKNPTGLYAVAQLSPYVVWPPDGLNLKQGAKGELFGYGYLPLPLTEPKTKTAGKDVPTGNQCWTLFLNSQNFKGPVAFFTPYFWSKASVQDPSKAGQFLDSRPSEPNRAVQMETQHIPAMVSQDSDGNFFARIAPTHFPGTLSKSIPLIHRMTVYKRESLWNSVDSWFKGGSASNEPIRDNTTDTHKFSKGGYATWRIYLPGKKRDESPEVDWSSYAKPVLLDSLTYSYEWEASKFGRQSGDKSLVTLPEYYKLGKDAKGKAKWLAVSIDSIPAETGLKDARFPSPTRITEPYVTPDEASSSWKKPGPAAGPFKRILGDGSEITYSWYRFCDQPALLNADLTNSERAAIQRKVELLHTSWKKDRNYLPPPTQGKLASVDPALLVQPPKGMEVGYVPIVTRQEWSAEKRRQLGK